jgi:Dullard-like phosphatase family protein
MNNNNEKLTKRQRIEERVKFFLSNKHQIFQVDNNFENNKFMKDEEQNNISTIKIYNNYKSNHISTIDETFLSKNNYSNYSNNENTIKRPTSILVNKGIAKYVEPRFKIKEFQKLAPKFLKSTETSFNVSQILNQDSNDIEMLEIDEKVPQEKINQIEERRNRLNIYKNFPFNYFFEQEKCYQELTKDLKSNGIKNLDYKIKIGATYLNILMKEDNPISHLFIYNKEVNKFLIRELCFYLIVLFLNDFQSGFKNSDLTDLNNCVSYCHLNFLFALMLIVKNTKINIFEDLSELDKKEDFCYNSYLKCKTIIELNYEKIDDIQYKKNFRNYNKCIKQKLFDLLRNLSFINNTIAENILKIFYCTKDYSLSDVMDDFLKGNDLLNQKINRIIRDSIKPNISKLFEEVLDEENDLNEDIPKPSIPFLNPKNENDKREYCLVLDLDETLVHYIEEENEEKAYVKVRMGAEDFINILNEYCEIVIFTASTQYYANIVINGLDCKDKIDYKLYRQHTDLIDGTNVKDLSKLGRDLAKVIIIDNIEDNYKLQPNNGLNISDFEGDENDNELIFLLNDLLKIVKTPGLDIRNELNIIRINMQKRYMDLV